MKYTVKGLGKEQTMESKVKIWTDGDKVMRVEDRWGGELKEGAVRDVSILFCFHCLFCAWEFWRVRCCKEFLVIWFC